MIEVKLPLPNAYTIVEAISRGQAHDAILVPELLKLMKDLLSRFVKGDVIESLVTCNDVISFDTSFKKKKVNDRNMLGFRTNAKSLSAHSFVQEARSKDTYQTPITQSLDPRNMDRAEP